MVIGRRGVLSGLAGIAASPLLSTSTANAKGVDTRAMRRMVEEFIKRVEIPGASIAIARKGKLIFDEPVGVADPKTGERVERGSLFRIASVSKPITACAIFALIEAGTIKQHDLVFGEEGILGQPSGTVPLQDRMRAVTIDHLLTHTAGGWQNDGRDPMFSFHQVAKEQLIAEVLSSRPLSNDPGTAFAYSNFGYFVLGRVIEKVTGKPYSEFVKERILEPSGITTMRIAGNGQDALADGEVNYLAKSDGNPFGFDIDRMDSHGGWIASASDLVRFLLHFDAFKSVPDGLKARTIKSMVAPSKANPNYARGWAVNRFNNWWHNGSLPGTSSLVVRASNGFCWAMLANSRDPFGDTTGQMDTFVWDLLERTGLI